MAAKKIACSVPAAALAAATLVGLVGCGSDSGTGAGDLCDFLADTGNCYRTVIAAIDSCSGLTSNFSGTFSADNKTCTGSGGVSASFSEAPDLSKSYDVRTRAYTLVVNGKTCATISDHMKTTKSLAVTGPSGGVFSVSVDAGGNETISCPDGKSFVGSAATVLSKCPDKLFSLPGTTYSGDATHDSWSLTAGEAGYDCSK
jgi:hypothetical protein